MSDTSSDRDPFEVVAESFLARYRAGERPSIEGLAARHPELAAKIRRLLPAMVRVEQDLTIEPEPAAKAMQAASPNPARQLGDYRILREVGRGGMGTVYEAEQVSLGRRVALKVLPGHAVGDRRAEDRFRREAKAAARLHHTNIVPVFEVGREGDVAFYAMQLIVGQGLDQVIAELARLRGHDEKPMAKGTAASGRPANLLDRLGTASTTAAEDRGRTLEQVAESLLIGRLGSGDRVTAAGDACAVTEADGSEAFGLTSTAGDRTRELARPSPEPAPPGGSSGSAVLPGGTGLSSIDSSGRRQPYFRSVAQIARQVAQGLAYAHARGVVHRDIKPSNLLLDTAGVVWITDFGLAKAEEDGLTATGDILGTLRYMPPERFRGEGDARADIYALGMTLYELLTLRPAHDVNDRLKLIERIKNEEPTRPRDLDPRIPRDLETIVLKAIEKAPGARYQTAEALGEDLRRFLADEPIKARQVGAAERYWRWARRNPVIATLGGVLTAVLTVGLVVMSVLWSRAERSATTARTLATQEAKARADAQALAEMEAKARTEADARTEELAREDYVNRVNRAFREVNDSNVGVAEDLLHGCSPERRGWEWNYVERLCNLERRVLDKGDLSVNTLAYGPDGTWVVSGSGTDPTNPATSDQTVPDIEVWEVRSGRRLKALPGARGRICCLAVSPDGKGVAAGLTDGLVMLWDVATGRTTWSRHDPGKSAMALAFNPDGRSLAVGYGAYSGNQEGQVRILDRVSGKQITTFAGPRGGVNKLAYHPDGKRLALAGSEVVEVWGVADVRKVQDLKGHKKWIYTLAYSPDGQWLASGGWDRTVKLRHAETGLEAVTIFAHEGFVLDLGFSPDSRSLVTTSEDRTVRLWEIPSGRSTATFHGHADFVNAVAFQPDGRNVVSGGLDGSIRFWNLRTSRPIVIEHTAWVERLAYRRDGLRVLSQDGRYETHSRVTKCWDPLTGELDTAVPDIDFASPPAEFVGGSAFFELSKTSPGGDLIARSLLATGQSARIKDYVKNSVIVVDTRTGQVAHTLSGHSGPVVCLAFSPDGRRLATGSYDRTVKLWDMKTGKEVFTLIGHTAGVVSLAFSPDGNRLITGGIDSTARVWDATPLASNVSAQHDASYQRKVTAVSQMTSTTDDLVRVKILAEGGRWDAVARTLAKVVEGETEVWEATTWYLLALLESGDSPGYRAAADRLLARFRSSHVPDDLYKAAWSCCYAEAAVPDLTVPVQVAEAARGLFSTGLSVRARRTLGPALYRAGRINEAIAQLEGVVKAEGNVGVPQDWIFLAMAHHRKGNADEASRWLGKVRAFVNDTKTPFSIDLAECRVLLREADALLRQPPPAHP